MTTPPPPPPDLDEDEQILARAFKAIGSGRRLAGWLRLFAWTFAAITALAILGLIIASTTPGNEVLLAAAIGYLIASGLFCALLAAAGAVLDLQAARVELAIHDSPLADDDQP